MMRVKVAKWGNSLALRIPSGLAEDAQLAEGTEVEVGVEGGRLVVAPALSLDALLARVTPENLHAPLLDGPERGREVW